MRILLVEDDVKIASFIIKGLKAAGYAVDHARDGEEGLHLALTEPYDTAIIDIMLPKLDGLVAHRKNAQARSCARRSSSSAPKARLMTALRGFRPGAMIISPSRLLSPNCLPGYRH